MTFKLSLVTTVYPTPQDVEPGMNIDLLQKANAWLQRRNAGFNDDMLIVGIGFEDELALKAMVTPYGLGESQLRVEHIDREDDDFELGECMSRAISQFRPSEAISIVNWKGIVEKDAYPLDGWWWVGLSSVKDEQASALEVVVRKLVTDTFLETAKTWVAVLVVCMDLNAIGEDHEVYEAHMTALTFARWLNGFDAATENNFYDFDVSEAINTLGSDTLRLGFEASHNHGEELSELVYGDDVANDNLGPALLLACLDQRNSRIRDALSSAFGGNSALFWSLYTTIWPEFKSQMIEAMDDLLNMKTGTEEGDLDRPWRFVTHGWSDFSEELY